MTDIVERLRSVRVCEDLVLLDEAAAEIERLGLVADAEMKLREGNFSEIERLRADAERYRWLRVSADNAYLSVCERDGYGGYCLMHAEELDEAIDAARTAQAPGASREL